MPKNNSAARTRCARRGAAEASLFCDVRKHSDGALIGLLRLYLIVGWRDWRRLELDAHLIDEFLKTIAKVLVELMEKLAANLLDGRHENRREHSLDRLDDARIRQLHR